MKHIIAPPSHPSTPFQAVPTLITGGSRGLGRALGQALAQAGAHVVLVARGAAALATTVAEIRARGGVAHGVVADVAARADTHAIASQAAALVGPIDLLINNASTLGPTPLRLLLDTDCEDLTRALEVNVTGPFRLTKAVAGSMVLRGGGTIVNISSDASVESYPTWGAYGVSKAALDHLGRIWAAELSDTGVRVLTLDPGEMNTRMHADAIPDADPARLADPADVAERIVALLASTSTPASGLPSGARVAVPATARVKEVTP